jgi:hypothetical protein
MSNSSDKETTKVYLLWHWYPNDPEDDNAKLLGVYSSRTVAETKIEEKYKKLPGFDLGTGELTISEYTLDEDQWNEGFFRDSIDDA